MNELQDLEARLAYREQRLANAEALGRPAHVQRCADRVEGLRIRLATLRREPLAG